MCEAIRHRGPDEDGFYLNEGIGLAMRRLSIIDLKGGQQPIHNRDRTAWIVFNGEIYNYKELREQLEKLGHTFYTNSDTEAIIHAYDQYGADCPKHLRGMFAFAIWDTRTEELFLARDRVGKKPLLYSLVNNQLIFGSEFSALLQHPDISRDVAPEAIHYYLSFMCVPAPLTAYRAIKKLEPGHSLKFARTGEIKIERYWQPEFSPKVKVSEEEAGHRAVEILRDAVRVRLMSEVPLGAFLSGGVDSSAVVALMSEAMSEPVKTFSIGFPEREFDELEYARAVASRFGTDHREFVVEPDALAIMPKLARHYGEPYADPSAIPSFYLSELTKQHVTVALNGDGGDESFAGYSRYRANRMLGWLRSQAAPLRAVGGLARKIPEGARDNSARARVRRLLGSAGMSPAERYLS